MWPRCFRILEALVRTAQHVSHALIVPAAKFPHAKTAHAVMAHLALIVPAAMAQPVKTALSVALDAVAAMSVALAATAVKMLLCVKTTRQSHRRLHLQFQKAPTLKLSRSLA
jgi:hypothetical protein